MYHMEKMGVVCDCSRVFSALVGGIVTGILGVTGYRGFLVFLAFQLLVRCGECTSCFWVILEPIESIVECRTRRCCCWQV